MARPLRLRPRTKFITSTEGTPPSTSAIGGDERCLVVESGVPIFARAFRGPREAREGAVQKQGRGHFRHFPPAARRERLGPVEPLERRLDCAALFRADGNDAHVGVDDVEVAREQVAAVVGHHLQAGQPVALKVVVWWRRRHGQR